VIANARMRSDVTTRLYVNRHRTEGKSDREIAAASGDT
jgi:hypothetical protein